MNRLDRAWDAALDDAMTLVFVGVGFVVLVFLALGVALLWLLISALIVYLRRKEMEREAGDDFDRVLQEEGVLGFKPEDVFQAYHLGGVEPPGSGSDIPWYPEGKS